MIAMWAPSTAPTTPGIPEIIQLQKLYNSDNAFLNIKLQKFALCHTCLEVKGDIGYILLHFLAFSYM
jgi:hypothetical protein